MLRIISLLLPVLFVTVGCGEDKIHGHKADASSAYWHLEELEPAENAGQEELRLLTNEIVVLERLVSEAGSQAEADSLQAILSPKRVRRDNLNDYLNALNGMIVDDRTIINREEGNVIYGAPGLVAP